MVFFAVRGRGFVGGGAFERVCVVETEAAMVVHGNEGEMEENGFFAVRGRGCLGGGSSGAWV